MPYKRKEKVVVEKPPTEPQIPAMKVCVFDHEHLPQRFWDDRERNLNERVAKKRKNFPLQFDVIQTEFKGIEWRSSEYVKSYKSNKTNFFKRVSYDWFRRNFTDKAPGYDVVICHLSSDQYEVDGKHDSGGESLMRGEIIMRGHGKEWEDRFVHEETHDQCDHKWKIKDVTHLLDKYGMLDSFIKVWI